MNSRFVAPPLPAEAQRRTGFVRALTGVGLLSAAAVLLLVNLVLFLATNFFFATPEQLYHRVWRTTAEHIYDPAALKNWSQWEHKYDGKLNSDEDAAGAIKEMLDSIGDRYTYFMDAKAVQAQNERQQGNFTGVGMVFGVKLDANGQPVKAADGNPLPESDDDGYPVVKQLINGAPAKKSGLKVGDAITTVDGKDTRGLSLDQLVTQVRGQAGTQVIFGLRRAGQDLPAVTLTREKINVPAVTTKMLPGDIGYLRLEGFDQLDAADEFESGLNDLKHAKALIIDLRGNPGGFVHNAIAISSFFIEQGTVVSIRTRIPGDPKQPQYREEIVKLTPNSLITEVKAPSGTRVRVASRRPYLADGRPVVVIVNGNSASASEMFTGAVKDNGAATVLGVRTFGKGIGQSNIPMPNGTQLHVTSLRYFTPNGTWLGDGGNSKASGIEPDIKVEPNKNLEFGEDSDNQLEKAVDVLNKKLGGGSYRPFFRTRASCAG